MNERLSVIESLETTIGQVRRHLRKVQEAARQTLHMSQVYAEGWQDALGDLEDCRTANHVLRLAAESDARQIKVLDGRARELALERTLAEQNARALEKERDALRDMLAEAVEKLKLYEALSVSNGTPTPTPALVPMLPDGDPGL